MLWTRRSSAIWRAISQGALGAWEHKASSRLLQLQHAVFSTSAIRALNTENTAVVVLPQLSPTMTSGTLVKVWGLMEMFCVR